MPHVARASLSGRRSVGLSITAPCRLSLKRVYEAARTVDSVFLHTPQFVSEPLREASASARRSKLRRSTRCARSRGADFLVSSLKDVSRKDVQPTPQLVCASAGNFGQAVAYAARKHSLPSRSTPPQTSTRSRSRGRAFLERRYASGGRISTPPNSLLGFPSVGEKPDFDGR